MGFSIVNQGLRGDTWSTVECSVLWACVIIIIVVKTLMLWLLDAVTCAHSLFVMVVSKANRGI